MRVPLCLATLLLCFSFASAKDDGKEVFTDPDSVPASYAIQGEYEGQAGDDSTTYGGQIIALGDDKFHLVAYEGGLPDADQSHTEIFMESDGKMDGDAAVFQHGKNVISVSGGELRVLNPAGNVVATIPRVTRESETLGAKPPKGATVLFDGSNGDAFEGSQVDDGLLLANCFSNQKFGDHTMHIEFRTPYKPKGRGQGRGNSGVYVQSRYELQVLDSFGLSGEDNECGGIYSVSKPKVNMCYPPLQWQTYDIDFTAATYDGDGNKRENARITVRHNGVVIHDDLELPHHTPGRHQEGPEPDALYLQGHGNPVYYRNIWVVEK